MNCNQVQYLSCFVLFVCFFLAIFILVALHIVKCICRFIFSVRWPTHARRFIRNVLDANCVLCAQLCTIYHIRNNMQHFAWPLATFACSLANSLYLVSRFIIIIFCFFPDAFVLYVARAHSCPLSLSFVFDSKWKHKVYSMQIL